MCEREGERRKGVAKGGKWMGNGKGQLDYGKSASRWPESRDLE